VRVGVVTGGRSRERDRSLLSGQAVAEALTALGHHVRVVDPAEPGLIEALAQVDVAFLAIAGRYAEDGKLQGLLETLGIPYTGSGVLASALGMHKPSAKAMVAAAGVPVLEHECLDPEDAGDVTVTARTIMDRLGGPVIVKPAGEGGSVGVAVAHDPTELVDLIAATQAQDGPLLVEPFVSGPAATVGVLGTSGELVALPVLVVEAAGEFYDHAAKRDPALHVYHCPAPLPAGVADKVGRAAVRAHRALGCWGYSRSDFIIDANGKPWWLEVNTLPGLSRGGNLATMAAAAGIAYEELVSRILATATDQTGYRP
jgi:D-alanine-D-alanine ligase